MAKPTAMMNSTPIIERAFELARSGGVGSLRRLEAALKQEGYTVAEIGGHLSGRALQTQLTAAIRAAETHRDEGA